MKELVERTGVPASAIRHYLAQGLLPRPKQVHKRLHLYAPETVDRVLTIKRMQRTEHLPLDVIARRIKLIAKGTAPETAREIDADVLGGSTRLARYDLKALARRSGAQLRSLQKAQRAGCLVAVAPGNDERRYDESDLLAAKRLHDAAENGMSAEHLEGVASAARVLAEAIIAAEREAVQAEGDFEDRASRASRLLALGRDIGHYVLDRVIQRAAQKQLA
jgi:DNA-binding transcriptional MerR regulator